MNKNIELRYVQIFEALVTAIAMCELHSRELYDDVDKLNEEPEKLLRVLSRVWGIVDDIYRVRQLVQSIPGLNMRTPQMRRFITGTEITETFLHYIQHLRQELTKPESITTPVWGSLSWIDPLDETKCYTAVLGRVDGEVQNYSCVFDRYEKKWVSRVAINIKGASFNIDPVLEEVQRAKSYVLQWLTDRSSFALEVKVEYPVFAMKIEI